MHEYSTRNVTEHHYRYWHTQNQSSIACENLWESNRLAIYMEKLLAVIALSLFVSEY